MIAAAQHRVRVPAFAGYALDLDGTVYLDEAAVPGAREAIEILRARGSRIVFVTNKPLAPASAYAAILTRIGIPATAHDVVTALDVLVRYLCTRHLGRRLLLVAEDLVARELAAAGFDIVTDPARAEVVVVSFDRGFDYHKLNAAYRAVKGGATIVATNPDPYCPTADGGLPDCAAMLAAIEACTETRAEAVVGKPSSYMAAAFLERLGVPVGCSAMVGDRLSTDVAMGLDAGMTGILVTTGATRREDIAAAAVRPDLVIDSLMDLVWTDDDERTLAP